MTISFSGLASGLDTSSWVEALVSVKQEKITSLQTDLMALQQKQATLTTTKSAFSSFRSAIEKITDAKFGGSFDLFSSNTATSSNTDIFTATVDNTASRQSYDIVVKQLATCTKATSKEAASKLADDDTKLSNIGIKAGSLSVYLDGVKTNIEIEKDDTLGDLKAKLAAANIKTEFDEKGTLKLSSYDESCDLNIGATTDTANFLSITGLEKQEDGSYTSTNALYKVSTATKLTAEDAGFNSTITEGTFTIGTATFKIDGKTTLSSIISAINSNSEAQAYAYWDETTGKLSITSTKDGASYINIEAGTSNFTDVMGLTETVRDEENNIITSKIYTDVQELGKNALLTINGTNVTSTSNTVSSDVSRLTGVTLKLNKVSEDEEGNEVNATLKVEQNTKGLADALKNFVSAYNDVVAKIDEVTASGADFQKDSSLSSFKNTLRTYANGSNTTNGGAYKLLSQIGISTGEADASNISTECNTLQFNEDVFNKAMQDDPDSVKAILAGENGIFNHIENSVEQMLSASSGYFDIQTTTFQSDMMKLNDKISSQSQKVATYRTQLEDKFYKMELAISQMQQNYSSFLSGGVTTTQ